MPMSPVMFLNFKGFGTPNQGTVMTKVEAAKKLARIEKNYIMGVLTGSERQYQSIEVVEMCGGITKEEIEAMSELTEIEKKRASTGL